MLHERQLGRNGAKPETCAITGRTLTPDDVYTKVGDVKIGVKATAWRGKSAAERADLLKEWGKELSGAPSRKTRTHEVTPELGVITGE